MLPNLLSERLDEYGIDYAVLYSTAGFGLLQVPDTHCQRAACSAFYAYGAEMFVDHSDRMTPAAVIPVHDLEEAVADLEYANSLGLKTVMMGSVIKRPSPELEAQSLELAAEFPWLDVIGLDIPHDYDAVWQRCFDLGILPTFHSRGLSRAFGLRNSVSIFYTLISVISRLPLKRSARH